MLHALALATVVMAVVAPHVMAYDASDTLAAIEQASASTGIAYSWLHRVVGCETGGTFSPTAIGDHGTSFGAAQLHRGGLLGTFYATGGTDPMNPYEAISFMADRFAAGQSYYWSCK